MAHPSAGEVGVEFGILCEGLPTVEIVAEFDADLDALGGETGDQIKLRPDGGIGIPGEKICERILDEIGGSQSVFEQGWKLVVVRIALGIARKDGLIITSWISVHGRAASPAGEEAGIWIGPWIDEHQRIAIAIGGLGPGWIIAVAEVEEEIAIRI